MPFPTGEIERGGSSMPIANPAVDGLAAQATTILERLIAFDTTSRGSNLELIAYVETELASMGASSTRVGNEGGTKSSLYATLGPAREGGVLLSGHTDVVPVDGQAWSSDPFRLTQRGERLYGRGTCDMKGFLSLALAAAPAFMRAGGRPVHLAFSYDEEIGCLGAPALIREIAAHVPAPRAVIVGEPTNMAVVSGHKSVSVWTVTVTGHEAHSSLTHLGLSANAVAARLMGSLQRIADELETRGGAASPFHPPHATLTIGQIQGGTAVNILAGRCTFIFDLRCPPGIDPDAVVAPFLAEVEAANRAIRARFPAAGIAIVRLANAPALSSEPDGAAEALVRDLASDHGAARVVSYAAEAGQFQEAGFSTVICGPGSIEQAHQPDEYIEVSQIQRGAAFMLSLAASLAD
jgi:acetylornithine deacetylase